MKRLLALLCLMCLLAACEPQTAAISAPTVIPFPTMTPGRTIRGLLPTVASLPLDGSPRTNPATAVALAIQPTLTPDYTACPPAAAPALAPLPADPRDMADEITRFLSNGGTPATLQAALRDEWDVLGEAGVVRADLDVTGEGEADVLLAFNAGSSGGVFMILGCADGRYQPHYQLVNPDGAPQLLYVGDMNQNNRPEVLFTAQTCNILADNAGADCVLETRLIGWQPQQARFESLLVGTITSQEPPGVSDIDDDRVLEIAARLSSAGTAQTGPLRTGLRIYDWNGANYLLSITQLDPPRFRIQIIHQADRSVQQRETDAAVDLYQLALNDSALQNWFDDEADTLNAYVLYRLLTVYAFTEDERLLSIYQAILNNYPDIQAAPVYASMGITFWDTLQQTNNMRSACNAVQAIITARPEALDLLNRYGSRSPTYTASDLCPF